MRDLSRNLWFDLIRGCSALVVCLGHLRNAILVDYSALVNPSIAIKAFYFLTSLGHEAVMIFFVLSGYFVGGTILRTGAKFSWKNYLISRLTRLWVVLIPCLLITWGIGLIVGYYFPEVLSGANYDLWHSGPRTGEYSANFTTFIANILFLQTIAFPVFGTNSPLWSLANEFWYYMLFPLFAIAIGLFESRKHFFRAVEFVFAMIIVWLLPGDVMFGFIVWMLGVLVYVLQPRVKSLSSTVTRILLGIGLVLFCLSLVNAKFTFSKLVFPIDPDIVVGLSFAFLCLILTKLHFPKVKWPNFANFSLYLSDISYSLYLSHFPLVVLIASMAYKSQKLVPDGLMLTKFFGWGFLLAMLGSAVWWCFESRTALVRTKVIALLNLRTHFFK